MPTESVPIWYRDAEVRRLILLGYLPWLAGLNLAWEIAHTPLYTLWEQAPPAYVAFAVVHCTMGDVLIGAVSLVLALVLGRERTLDRWRWSRIIPMTVLFSASYTIFSEWLNTHILRSWSYSGSMPVIDLWGLGIGLSPLMQWLMVPPLALWLASHTQIGRGGRRKRVR